jgi:hypothetical protein
MEVLAVALFLAALNKSLVELLVAPLRRRFPKCDYWWVAYVSIAGGVLLAYASRINLFADYIADPLTGMLLTGLTIGGGASLIHDIVSARGGGRHGGPSTVEVNASDNETVYVSHRPQAVEE